MEGGQNSTQESHFIQPLEGLNAVVEAYDTEYDDISEIRLTIELPNGRVEYDEDDYPMTPPFDNIPPLTPHMQGATTSPREHRPLRYSTRISLPPSSLQPSPAPPRILMMPRRSEPQLQLFHTPQTRGRASTSAFHLRRPIIDMRPRLAPLKSKARPSEKEKLENEVLPNEMVDHMFAMTPRSTSSSPHENEFISSNSPIAVIEDNPRLRHESKMDRIMTTANQLGIAVFVDMMLKLVMFLVFMSYIDPIRMVFSIFGYSSSFSFSVRQYFMFMTFCAFDILMIGVWGWEGFGDKQLYRTVLNISNISIIVIEMSCTTRLLVFLRSLSPDQFQELQDR